MIAAHFYASATLFVCGIAVLVATRLRVGYVVSPFSVTMVMIAAIFGVRPLLVDGSSRQSFYGYITQDGMEAATMVGLLAAMAVCVGYWFRTPRDEPTTKDHIAPKSGWTDFLVTVRPSAVLWVSAAVITLWVGLMATRAGGLDALQAMTGGRSAQTSRLVENLPIFIYCLPASASIAASAWRLRSEGSGNNFTRRNKAIFWIIIAAALIPPALLGNRRFILPCVIAAIIAANSSNSAWHRRLRPLYAALGVVGFLTLAIIPYVRSAGSRQANASLPEALLEFWRSEGLSGVLANFFTSYDTEMLDFIAYASPRLGSSLEYGLGRGTVVDVLTAAIPSRIASTESWSNAVLKALFNSTCSTGICPVPSFAGTAYFDFGYVGVAILGLALGVGCRIFASTIRKSSGFMMIALLVLGSLPATAIRGNYPSQLWIGFNIAVGSVIILGVLRAVSFSQASQAMEQVTTHRTVPGR